MADVTSVADAASSETGTATEQRLSRRQLLRTGVNVGVGTGLVWTVGSDLVSSGGTRTITYALARPEPGAESLEPRTKEVPAAWYEGLQLGFGIQEQLRRAGLQRLVDSFVVPGSYDEPGPSISVRATDEAVSQTLENVADAVEFDLDVVDELVPGTGGEFDLSDAYHISDLDGKRVPGGVLCKAGESYGTLTPALFDAETGSRYFATSNHMYGDGTKEREHHGEPLSIPYDDETYEVGNVERGYPVTDVVKVAPTDGYRPTSSIERASPSHVIGQYTRVGLADLMARGESLTKLGAMSDRTSGAIKGVDGMTCYTGRACKSGQLKWGGNDTFTDGDSGSVTFHPDPEYPDDYVLVGGINNARIWPPVVDFAWGTAAHHLLDEYGLHF